MYLSKRDMNVFNDPDRCPMIFDTILAGRSAAGNLDTLPNPGRFPGADGGRNTIGFLDGHVKLMTHAQVASKDADGKPLVR